jgi:hypothetical protein
MPRNSSGNFILPVGNPVIPDTLIEAQWANVTMDDLAQGLTDSLDRQGRGGMLAAFKLADGTQTQPGLGFLSEPSLGLHRAGTSDMRAVVLGQVRQRWHETGVEINGLLTGTAVTQSATDNTAGRLLKVADFGLGGLDGVTGIPQISDFNNASLAAGFYWFGNTAVNRPPAGDDGSVFITRRATTGSSHYTAQTAFLNNGLIYTRNNVAGVFGAWREVMTSANVTTSATDTTAGRLTKVGDFGLGLDGTVAAPQIADFNVHQATGIYRAVGSEVPNGPITTNTLMSVIATRVRNDYTVYHVRDARGFSWIGDKLVSAAVTWQRVYQPNSILGTVSQSGGVPTGAIIERGANTNGTFIRFADGTQICTAILTSSATADITWTYPAVFSAAPHISGVGTAADRVLTPGATQVSATQFSFRLWLLGATPARATDNARLVAIGRWF